MPVRQGGKADSGPYAIVSGIHNRGLRCGGNPWFYMEAEQVTGNPAKADGSGCAAKQEVAEKATADGRLVSCAQFMEEVAQEYKSRGKGNYGGIDFA